MAGWLNGRMDRRVEERHIESVGASKNSRRDGIVLVSDTSNTPQNCNGTYLGLCLTIAFEWGGEVAVHRQQIGRMDLLKIQLSGPPLCG